MSPNSDPAYTLRVHRVVFCSASFPPRPDCPPQVKAGDGNRTHVACLEGRYSTIELHPRFRRRPSRRPEELVAGHKGRSSFMAQVSSAMVRISSGLRPPSQSFILSQFCGNYHRSEPGRVIESHPIPVGINMGGAGFEPAKALPPDLQSGPFGRLGIHPLGARFP